MPLSNLKFRRFLVQFLHNLEPRRYLEMEKIQDQYQEVFETVYVMNGSILIGYRLFNEIFYAKRNDSKQFCIGDFSCMNNKVSEFLYVSHEITTAFAIKREQFVKLMQTQVGKLV